MPKSFGEWLTTFTQVQKVPGATGLWCRAFLLCGGQHNDCRHEMGPIWRESNKQLEWMVILEGFSLKVHCWGWQYRDPEKWGWFIYIYTHMIWCNCWRQTGFSATGLHFPICFPWQRSYASASFTMLSWNLAQMIYTPKANGVTWKRSTLEKAKKAVNQPTPSNLGF